MKYLSVCSGIEAATVAWHGLGWEPVAFAEIEAFPAAVLSHHYPTVPNLGDLTKYREWPEKLLQEAELLVGGTPCQAFSVAGKRQSLDDERGNLSLVYVNLFHHINEARKRHGRSPAIALWENVPGVLSTKDNAFGCFIGGLLGCDEAPKTESGKWDKAGFLSSETVRVGYRVLDAQYFGVAQRRRRVFLVAVPCELVKRFGERVCPSEILSLRESVLGNPPSRGAAWEGTARTTAAGLTSSGRGVERPGESRGQDDVVVEAGPYPSAQTLMPSGEATSGSMAATESLRERERERAPSGSQSLDGQDAQRLRQHDGLSDSCRGVCFHPTQDPISSVDGSTHALSTGSSVGWCSVAIEFMDTESHSSGDNIELAPCMRVGDNAKICDAIPHAVAFKPSHFTRGKDGSPNAIAPPLSADADKGDQDTVIAIDGANQGYSESIHHSLRTGRDSEGGVAFAFAQNQLGEVRVNSGVMSTVNQNQNQNASGRNTPMIQDAMQVRRLCPAECEALQGFPIGYTDVPYRNKPAADGPRYRALGNSMAVPCMWWLGIRISQATTPRH